MHQVFAAVRIWQLEHRQGLKRHAKVTAERIFGAKRWKECCKQMDSDEERERLQNELNKLINS